MPRSSLGHYRILERVGSGGMGEVYSAEDLNLRRKVALKVLPRELSENPVARQRLVREARSASQLGHANIATIYEVGEDAGELYVAMELVEGQSLAQRIRSDPLSPEEIATIGAQVADALEAAHRQGVVHRDVKPGNILIRDDGAVKVVDFGLAIHTDAPPRSGRSDHQPYRGDSPHPFRFYRRDRGLHEPRAGQGRGGYRCRRHLRARDRAVRDGDGDAAVPGSHAAGGGGGDRARAARTTAGAAPRDPGGAREDHPFGA